jgi:hypothetical protein
MCPRRLELLPTGRLGPHVARKDQHADDPSQGRGDYLVIAPMMITGS